MSHARRRILAVTSTIATVLTVSASPAVAAEPSPYVLTPRMGSATVALGSDGEERILKALVEGPSNGSMDRITYTIDTADVADMVTIEFVGGLHLEPDECKTTGTVMTCWDGWQAPFHWEGRIKPGMEAPIAALQLKPKAGAKVGDVGKLAFTVRADDGVITAGESVVRIGEPVDLESVAAAKVPVAAGGAADLQARVRNVGTSPVNGAVLLLSVPDKLLASRSFRNCTYGLQVACSFGTVLQPGKTYGLSAPLLVRAPADAITGSLSTFNARWSTVADWTDRQELLDAGQIGKPGTGAAVELVELSSTAAAPQQAPAPQQDVEHGNDSHQGDVVVTGGKSYNGAAVGATIAAAPGTEVTTRIGMTNKGTGSLHRDHFPGNNHQWIDITAPRGVHAVKLDDRCLRMKQEQQPEKYVCAPGADVRSGETVLFDFTFRLADGARDNAGAVTMREQGDELDRQAADDKAALVLDVTGGDSGGTGGGTLPITGANSGLIAAVGALLLVTGIALWLPVRRRRTLFTV